MDLWIRSQNKNILENCKSLFITHSSEDQWNICNYISFTHYGTYKTEERALEVLDEIQDLMRSLTDSDLKIIQYEMPKE